MSARLTRPHQPLAAGVHISRASTTSAGFDGLELWPAHVSARGNEVSVATKREVLKTFSNVYTTGEIIGEGGSGRVYRATDDGTRALGRPSGFLFGQSKTSARRDKPRIVQRH